MGDKRPRSFYILAAFFSAYVLFLYEPMIAIYILSFQGPDGGLTFPMNGVSLTWFGKVFSGGGIVDIGAAFKRSLALGLVVMVITVVLSVAAGMAFRKPFRGASILFYTAIASLIMPSIITSLGIALEFRLIDDFVNKHGANVGLGWLADGYTTAMGLFTSGLGAHLTWTLPFGLLIMFAIFNRFDGRLEEAARDLGATPWQTFRHVVLPIILPSVVGIGLFGSVYLMPVFLAFVRQHDAFEIGKIMLVTGVAQLIAAPLVTALDGKVDARLLTSFGFALFSAGLAASAFQPASADYQEMFWPQVVRGVGIMFCLLPPTRIALGDLPQAEVADASGLFNLMRNLGGAIGIALIDTIIYGRVGLHAQAFRDRLMAGDTAAAKAIGLAPELLRNRPRGVSEEAAIAYVRPLVEKASLALCVNEAWALLAGVALLGFILIPFARNRTESPSPRRLALEAAQPALRRRLDQLGPRSG